MFETKYVAKKDNIKLNNYMLNSLIGTTTFRKNIETI